MAAAPPQQGMGDSPRFPYTNGILIQFERRHQAPASGGTRRVRRPATGPQDPRVRNPACYAGRVPRFGAAAVSPVGGAVVSCGGSPMTRRSPTGAVTSPAAGIPIQLRRNDS
jgi:hypothetical protein